jgi:hypothetical protein
MAWLIYVFSGAVFGAAAAVAALTQVPGTYSRAEVDALVHNLRSPPLQQEAVYSRQQVDALLHDVRLRMPSPNATYSREEADVQFRYLEGRIEERAGAAPRITIHTSSNDIPTHLFYNERTIGGFTTVVQAERRGVALVDFHCDVEHRNLVNGVVGVGARLWYRFAKTKAGLANASLVAVPGAVTGTNILNVTHHYGQLPFSAAVPVEAGWYQFEVRIGSHSSLALGTDGLARINPGSSNGGDAYNSIRIVLIEGATMATSR